MSGEVKPRVVVESRGILFLLFLVLISLIMIFYGIQYAITGLLLWGLIILLSLILALIPILARIFIPKAMAEAIKRAEFEREIQKRIESYEKKHKPEQQTSEKV